MEVVNWKLAAHPMNWIIVFFMIFIAVLAADLVIRYLKAPKVQPE